MNFFDEARAIEVMLKSGKTTRGELAKSLGITESTLSNKLRLLQLDEKLQRKIAKHKISERHARTLLRLKDESEREELLLRIVSDNLSVAQAEALADIMRNDEVSESVGGAEKIKATDRFLDAVKSGVESLSALGIDAKVSTKISDSKFYISVIISDEN